MAAPNISTCPDELTTLLARLPEDAVSAAEDLQRAAQALAPVTVLVEDGSGWASALGEPVTDPGPQAIRRGPVALVTRGPTRPHERRLLEQGCAWLAMAVARDRALCRADDAAVEISAVTEVVERLLSVHDVDQLLLSISDRTLRLLDADICGVLLREGDEVCMRSCVGHRVIDTARLRMRRGQGVAGLVFQTGEPARVDRYVDDETISRDFVDLAEREQTDSALAVPMALPDEFLGVLEVWRRRPSVFTDQDVRRMVTLADFATIALRSAREHDARQRTLAQLGEAHDALKRQVGLMGRTAELQQLLISTVLDGGGLPALARCVRRHLGCHVGIYDVDGARLVGHSLDVLPEALTRRGVSGQGWTVPGGARVQPIHADGDEAGAVCLAATEKAGTEVLDAVVGQVAMACSLALSRERAASQVRVEALDEALWDLLGGSVEHRVAARGRVQQLGVMLRGDLRVVQGRLENLEELAVEQGWDTSRTDRARRDVLRAVRESACGGLALAGLRGDSVVAVAGGLDAPGAKKLVAELVAAIRAQHGGLRTSWGISRSREDVLDLPRAHTEATTALSASHRLGGENVFLYEELGVVRILLGSGSDPDLRTFVEDVTGPLVAYDRENDGALVRTLRAFFDADCSQRVAADRLFIHHKTMRYRLERIKALTGLDLSHHDDRMRADIALRLLQLGSD